MNWKKLFIAFIVIFIVGQVLMLIIHGLILDPIYERLAELFRPEEDMMSKMWIGYVTSLIFSFFFVYIFARGYEGKGIMEGVRFGLIIGCFWTIPSVYGQYMVYELPYYLVLQWLLYDFATLVILGILAALIYKPLEAEAKTA
jgi:hypothetical protein